ncbi:MAG: M24 family metallopeptidase, partial [Planctomycetaceae bacterium]
MFESVLSSEQLESHLQASEITNAAFARVWAFIAARIKASGSVQEQEVCDEILQHFEEHGATTYSPPIVGVNANGGNPHYATGTGARTTIREGDFVLVDLWAR